MNSLNSADGGSAVHSTTERIMKDVSEPLKQLLTIEETYDQGKPNTETLKNHLFQEGRLHESLFLKIIDDATKILKKEPNMLVVETPVTICGDVHGQFFDLIKLFEIGGDPSSTKYIFLGDYIDRGYFSTECVVLLWAYKICYPETFFLLRGNHECRELASYFTFKDECIVKYSTAIYDACVSSFDSLPLSALVNQKFFCVHGGISPEVNTLSDIMKINRFQEPPSHGPLCDLLWSDPVENFGIEEKGNHYFQNTVRGCSYFYTYPAICDFLSRNKLTTVIRGHEVQDAGFKVYKESPYGFPSLITVFSAPNYCDAYKNSAAVIKYEENNMNLRCFKAVDHPFWLPNFTDAFTWSLPFVGEMVTKTLYNILSICTEEELRDEVVAEVNLSPIATKIREISKVADTYTSIRQDTETILQLKGLAPRDTSPGDVKKVNSIREALHSDKMRDAFDTAKIIDVVNEAKPHSLEKRPKKSFQLPFFKKKTNKSNK